MTATLTFQMPEEQDEHELAVNAHRYRSALAAYDERLRQLVKYGSESEVKAFTADTARKWLWEAIRDSRIEDIH